MKCGFVATHGKAVKLAKPVNLTFWTPACKGCVLEVGGSWRLKPLPKKKGK